MLIFQLEHTMCYGAAVTGELKHWREERKSLLQRIGKPMIDEYRLDRYKCIEQNFLPRFPGELIMS